MISNKHAKWYKVIGGDFGAVKIGTQWRNFTCLYCLRNNVFRKHLFKKPRWQGPPSRAIINAMKSPYFTCTKNH